MTLVHICCLKPKLGQHCGDSHCSNLVWTDLAQFDRIVQALRSIFDLKERGALTDADYDTLKGQLLKRLESMETVAHPPQPLEGVLDLPPLEMYAADFHRMMVQQMYQEYPGEQGDPREYMQRMISTLAQQQALRPSDMLHMRMMVETVCDNRFGENIERLMEGAAQLQSIYNQVRLSAETSRLAKTVSGIAHNSAQNAVFGIEQATPQAAPMPKPEPARRWGIVKDDTNAALSGAGLALGIATIPGAQSTSEHPLPLCGMKPTVLDHRNLSNLHTLTLMH